MFKEIMNGFKKFFSRDRIIIFVILIILGYAIVSYSNSKSFSYDGMEDGNKQHPTSENTVPSPTSTNNLENNAYKVQPIANPAELLPNDENSQWSALNPVSANQGNIMMPDLLKAGYHIGLDTIGQTLRNPNYQIRSDPVIPKQDIGPWNQSTIEPDLGRVPLEIGYGVK